MRKNTIRIIILLAVILLSIVGGLIFTNLTASSHIKGYQIENYPCLGSSYGFPVGFYQPPTDYSPLAMPGCVEYLNKTGFILNVSFWFVMLFVILNIFRPLLFPRKQ